MKMDPKMWTLMAILLLVMEASSISVDIEAKPQFKAGENISFRYSISDIKEEIKYFVSVNCPDAPIPLLEMKTSDQDVRETYTYLTVDESVEPQNCTASVSVIEPYSLVEKVSFEIVTKPSFKFKPYLCRDRLCRRKARVFVRGEDIHIRYSSELSPTVTATVTYPDKEVRQITLPVTITAEQTGPYNLEIKASKQGYKNVYESVKFAVIGRHATIKDASECNADGTCSPTENYRNCPQDCPFVERPQDTISGRFYERGTQPEEGDVLAFISDRLYAIPVVILLLLLIGILIWRIRNQYQ